MRLGFYQLTCAAVLLTGCSGPGRSGARRAEQPTVPPEPYVRILEDGTNRIALQIAAREFVPIRSRQPVVWLTGVSHIGDSNYYSQLQQHLDAQSLVLFEGVGAAEAQAQTNAESAVSDKANDAPSSQPTTGSQQNGSLQSAMAASLGLVFQLEAIDYQRPNFRNSDLSISQLRDLMAQSETSSGTAGASESFEDLMQLMQGNSWFDALLQLALRLLGANPKFQALGRLALIDLLGQIQGDPSRLQGLPPEMKQLLQVLLERRNEKVMDDLKSDLAEVGRHGSIAVFFGTGHMPDMETRLRGQLGYQPSRQIWFTAFEVDLAAAKVSSAERKFVDDFVKWQLNSAKASNGKAESGKSEKRKTPGKVTTDGHG